MDLLIVIGALVLLMVAAYRGYSVILFAPIAAMAAVLLTMPSAVAPMFSEVFMVRMVEFLRNYFPVFMLGAIFGKLIELSGFSKSLVRSVIGLLGERHAILSIVLVCSLLTYGGVSLFVVVFAVYPFAAEMFRQSSIPKRLIPATIALGAFCYTMTALPGTPQIQNIIPTTFFGTNAWAAPWLGLLGAIFTFVLGMAYLEWRRHQAAGEGYGTELRNEPAPFGEEKLPPALLALMPLVLVAVMNGVFTYLIPLWLGDTSSVTLPDTGTGEPTTIDVRTKQLTAIWAVMAALLTGIVAVLIFSWRTVFRKLGEGSKDAVAGALLASMNTASEYGFGGVIAMLPGFALVARGMAQIPDPLVGEAVAVSVLAGITGSASGGMSIALATMADSFIAQATAAGIPMDVLHRVAAMASGGMDTLPHNGAVITLLAVTGLTHRESYRDVMVISLIITTMAVFFVIGLHYLTGLV